MLERSNPGDLPLLLIHDRPSGRTEIVLPGRHVDNSPRTVRALLASSGPTPAQCALIAALAVKPREDAAAVAWRRRKAFDPELPARRLISALKRLASEVSPASLLDQVADAFGRAARGEPPAGDDAVGRVLAVFRLSGTESTVEDRSWDPDPELLGSLLSALRAEGERSARGAFYTPRWVARHLARSALEGYLDERAGAGVRDLAAIREAAWRTPTPGTSRERLRSGERIERALDAFRACDPAAGSGSLLVALLQEMVLLREGIARMRKEAITHDARAAWRRGIAARSLFGIDADPQVLALCAARIALAVGVAPGDGAANLLCADVLGEGLPGPERGGFPADFDAVIANPPYVRQERLDRAAKRDLARRFPQVFRPKSDLHVFFCARAAELARAGGHLALVTNGKFLKAGYGEGLRNHFARSLTIGSLIDLGDLPVFRAAAYPVLLDARRAPPPRGHRVTVADPAAPAIGKGGGGAVPSSGIRRGLDAIEAAVTHARPRRVPQARLQACGWSFEAEHVAALERSWERTAKPLGEFVAGRLVRGVVTGLNDAFVIDATTRAALLARDPRTAEILRPWARGRDVRPWRVDPSGLSILFLGRGIDLARYPAVRAHLEPFRGRLTPREKSGDGAGRKPGRYRWYEIQDRIAYADAFREPKIVFSKFVTEPRFAWDESGAMTSNATGILPGAPAWLVAILQSELLWSLLRRRLTRLQNGYWQLMNANLLTLPIVEPDPGDRGALGRIVKRLASGVAGPEEERALAARAEAIVRRVYGVADSECETA